MAVCRSVGIAYVGSNPNTCHTSEMSSHKYTAGLTPGRRAANVTADVHLSEIRLDGHLLSSMVTGERHRWLPSQWAVCGLSISPTKVPSWESWRKARNMV